jgi:FtsH-binding integral membrane protein
MENNQFSTTGYKAVEIASAESRRFLLNVYNWMTMGLALTGLIAYAVSSSNTLIRIFVLNPFLFYGLLIFQLIIVIALSAAIGKIPSIVAIGAFFLVYTSASIASTFFICAAMFGSVSVFGYITKMDLSGLGTFMYMGLVGLIIASVVNFFVASSTLYWMISYVGVLIFVGLTAWDTQKIKKISMSQNFETEEGKKIAVMGALNLYLDFINMFLFLLRIMGNRR